MAKKSARGRTTVNEVTKTVGKVRTNAALMSDRVILIKYTWLKEDGTVDHTSGWKVKGKLRPDFPLDVWVVRRVEHGWTKVS